MPVSNCCCGGGGQRASSASASTRTSRRPCSCVTVAVGPRRNLERDAQRRGAVVVLRRDARHAQIADDEQPRGRAKVEPDVVDRRERAADEFNRHEPAVAAPRHGRRQRHEPARRGHQRLIGRQHDRLVLVGRGNRARGGVFAHLQLKQTWRGRRGPTIWCPCTSTAGSVRRPSRESTVIGPPCASSVGPACSRTNCRPRADHQTQRDVWNAASTQKVYMISVRL